MMPIIILESSSTLIHREDFQYACDLLTGFGNTFDDVLDTLFNRINGNVLTRSEPSEKVSKAGLKKLFSRIFDKNPSTGQLNPLRRQVS